MERAKIGRKERGRDEPKRKAREREPENQAGNVGSFSKEQTSIFLAVVCKETYLIQDT